MKLLGDDYPTRDGTCVRDYIHVTDLAEAHILAADKLADGQASLQLNLGTGDGFTVREVLAAVERAVGKPTPHTVHSRRAGDAIALVADPSQTRAALGWVPRLSDLDTICGSAWRFHRRKWRV